MSDQIKDLLAMAEKLIEHVIGRRDKEKKIDPPLTEKQVKELSFDPSFRTKIERIIILYFKARCQGFVGTFGAYVKMLGVSDIPDIHNIVSEPMIDGLPFTEWEFKYRRLLDRGYVGTFEELLDTLFHQHVDS